MTWARITTYLVLGFLAPSTIARADGPLGPDGSPITTSQYAIDFTRGTVLSASRVTGLSGAFTAIAEGVEGGLINPASVATRSAASVEFWDYWLALGLTYPLENGDYFNDGSHVSKPTSNSFYFLNPGAYLQLWAVGFGLDVDLQEIAMTLADKDGAGEKRLRLQIITNHVQAGTQLFDGNVVVGGGMQVLRSRVLAETGEHGRDRVSVNVGFGAEAGVLIRPEDRPWRIGASVYTSVKTRSGADEQDVMVQSIYLPASAVRPWTGSLGFAYQFGSRPLNPRFLTEDDVMADAAKALEERRKTARRSHLLRLAEIDAGPPADREHLRLIELAAQRSLEKEFDAESDALEKDAWRRLRAQVRKGWPRRYLLLTTDLAFTGRVDDAVGVSSFLAGTVQRSGERVSVTPRLGLESEVWPTHLKLRIGSYVEPARFRDVDPRVHGTAGFDVRCFGWDVFGLFPEDYLWQISGAIDGTRNYAAFSAGIGGWY